MSLNFLEIRLVYFPSRKRKISLGTPIERYHQRIDLGSYVLKIAQELQTKRFVALSAGDHITYPEFWGISRRTNHGEEVVTVEPVPEEEFSDALGSYLYD